MGYLDFFTFLIPLYGLSLGLDAVEIGILVGARSMLALFLSIHIGVLMDRFGTRRVTLRKLFHSRRTNAAVVRTARAAHPPRRALRRAVQGGAHSGRLMRLSKNFSPRSNQVALPPERHPRT